MCTWMWGRYSTTSGDSHARLTTSLSNSRIEFSLRKGSYQPEEYPYYWRVFETNDDYFDYYRPYHAFSKLYRIGIPDEVLKKVYYENALKITPALPQTGWPR